ncbi:hypothetical protein ACUOIJ_24780, partial [Escherichia coli]
DLELTARALDAALIAERTPEPERLLGLHRRLVRIFTADMAVFERKAYASLSHEPNKAMNLNAYIGLMGGRYRAERTPQGVHLRLVSGAAEADLV